MPTMGNSMWMGASVGISVSGFSAAEFLSETGELEAEGFFGIDTDRIELKRMKRAGSALALIKCVVLSICELYF